MASSDWRHAGMPPSFSRRFPPVRKGELFDHTRWLTSAYGPEGIYWLCPHIPRCPHRVSCQAVSAKGPTVQPARPSLLAQAFEEDDES